MNEHTLGAPQGDVGAGDIGLGSLKGHAAVHGVQAGKAQGVDLLPQELFQAEHTGGDKGQFHSVSFLSRKRT